MNELAFFEDYCAYFSDQNIQAIGDCFGPVTFYLPDGSNHSFSSRKALDVNTKKLFEIYNKLGFDKADFNLLAVIKLAESQHLCQLQWSLLDKQRKSILSFETAYLLSGNTSNYTITGVFVNDEVEKLNAAQQAQSQEAISKTKVSKGEGLRVT